LDDAPGARLEHGNRRQGGGEHVGDRQAPPARHHRLHQAVGGKHRDEPHEARNHGGDPPSDRDRGRPVMEQAQEEPERRGREQGEPHNAHAPPRVRDEGGVEVSDAITPRPSPVGTAVLRLRNRPARAASPAYSATMTWTTTNGQNVGLRSVFTAEVSTPTAMPTTGPASAVARIVPVVSRKRGRATASTAADSARLIATATGMSASSRTDTGQLP